MLNLAPTSKLAKAATIFIKLGWLGFLVGLSLNKVVLSVGIMTMSLGTFIHLFTSKPHKPPLFSAHYMMGMFGIFLLALVWSVDYNEGFNSIRMVVPLLSLGVSLCYTPSFKSWEKRWLIIALNLTLTFIVSYNIYFYSLYKPLDIRDMSVFGSHIRLGLVLVSVIILDTYYFSKKQFYLLLFPLLFLGYLIFAFSLTGLLLGSIALFMTCLLYFIKNRKWSLLTILILFKLSLTFFLILSTYSYYQKHFKPADLDISSLPLTSSHGHFYENRKSNDVENNNYVYTLVCREELVEVWPERTGEDLFSLDDQGQHIYWTLLRYMTSKGMSKDRDGVLLLSEEDISNIKKGYTNISLVEASSYEKKLYEIISAYLNTQKGTHSSTSSISDRLKSQKIALKSERNFWLGAGTGSIKSLMEKSAQKNSINYDYKLPHQQWISILLEQGFVFMTILLLASFYLIYQAYQYQWHYATIICIAFLSFLNEDTLNTQMGISYFCFALASYMLIAPKKTKEKVSS